MARSGLELQVKERAGRPIRTYLTRSALKDTKCNNSRCRLCQQNGNRGEGGIGTKPQCREKDLVYRIRCNICKEEYIGETKQPAAKRFRQHYPREEGVADSSIAEHHKKEHQGVAPDLEMGVLGSRGGYVYRKCLEAVWIQQLDPKINKLKEGSGCMNLYW